MQTIGFDCLQPHYSLFNRAEYERELAAACADQQVGVIPYSPLAAGFATGKYRREDRNPDTTRRSSGLVSRLIDDEDAYRALDVLAEIGQAHNAGMAHVALAWLLAKPTVTAPIIGARTVSQLREVLGAVDVRLSDHDVARIDAATAKY
ncbi:MAG: aldo/keto reductase [Anaerolineae bacterium]|nr:aldo/keto reductase [Anaerolineae bacterium]